MLVLLVDEGSSAMSFVNAGESPAETPAPVVEGDPASVLGPPDGVETLIMPITGKRSPAAASTLRSRAGSL